MPYFIFLVLLGYSLTAIADDPISKARREAHLELPHWISLTNNGIEQSISKGVSWEIIQDKYNISELSDLDSAELGDHYPVYRVTPGDILEYQNGYDFISRLELILYEFPIIVNGKVVSVVKVTPEKVIGFGLERPIPEIREQYKGVLLPEEEYNYSVLNFNNKFMFILRDGLNGLFVTGGLERDKVILFGSEYHEGTYPFMPLDQAIPILDKYARYFNSLK